MEHKIQSAYQEELLQLEKTSMAIDQQLKQLQAVPRYYGPDLTEQALEASRESARGNLSKASMEPYFGRLDFQEAGKANPKPLYIGKVGVEEETSMEPLVIDWRAPVASLFYSFTGGDDSAAYESPDGIVEGLIYLKRNLVIRKQILQRVVDTYDRDGDRPAVADEFLLYRLGENKDNRLRDIVSTIQAEQDRIIRSAKNTALIIQGVAGSGKTTVALHRLAYLLYQYRQNIRADKMIIFAPNSMFLDYISGVLPELGVGNIQQTTFSDWALNVLEQEVALADPTERLQHWFSIGETHPIVDNNAPGRFKGSVSFMNFIDECLQHYEDSFLPNQHFEPWEGVNLPAETIHQWFYTENAHYPLAKRKDRVIARIKRWLEMELDKIWETALKKELKKKSSQRLRSYLKNWPDDTAFTFYKQLFADTSASEHKLAKIPTDIAAFSQRLFKKKQVQMEDLAPLVHIHNRFHGIDSKHLFDHVVIDEAQDFSPFQVSLLNNHTRANSFTILGDLAQGIHAYQGITNWNEVTSVFGGEQTGYFELTRSYRSTMEIIRYANVILSRSGESFPQAVPVFRSGEKVKMAYVPMEERLSSIVDAVVKLQTGASNTIAVIGRTDKECAEIHTALVDAGIAASIIHAAQREYQGGISVLPAYLAKGLEFDAVLLVDADETHYTFSAQDAKLLYVGCTRALHELWVMYSGNVSPLIDRITEDLVEHVDTL